MVNSDTQITTAVPAGAVSAPIGVRVGATTSYTSFNFTVSTPAPTISSFTPTSGPVNRTTLTITGTNLQNASVITFTAAAGSSNNRVTSGYSINAAGTQITGVVVPNGAATGRISVTTPGGTATSTADFTVVPAPIIFSVSPSSGPAGTTVNISGDGFTGATSVTFGTTAATFNVSTRSNISAVVPAGLPVGQSFSVTVVTPGGSYTLPNAFVATANAINSFSPTSGPPGTVVTISGVNLTGATAVRFNGTDAPGFSVNSGGTEVTVAVPSGATTGPISVTTPAGTATSPSSFTVLTATNTAPTALALSNSTVAENLASGALVGTFTTTDPNAGDTHTYSLVTGAGSTGNSAFTISGNQLRTTATFDYEGQASYAIRVRTTDSGGLWLEQTFTVTVSDVADVPTITSFTPTGGPAGTVITVFGTNLFNITGASINNVAVTSAVNGTGGQATFSVPAGASTGPIRISTSAGSATSASDFVVGATVPAPTISSFTPTAAGAFATITINGTNLTGATTVAFTRSASCNSGSACNTVPASGFTVNAAGTQITGITVPNGVATGPITVTTPSGSATSTTDFVLLPPPLVTNYSPTRGPVGTPVRVLGSYFTGAIRVLFGNSDVPFTVVNDAEISVVVPAGAALGSTAITVFTPGGNQQGPPTFVVTTGAAISSFSPASGPAGTLVTISGVNLTGATAVRFNGTNAPGFSVNAAGNAITVAVPGGASTGPISVTDAGGFIITSASNFVVASSQPNLVVSSTQRVSGAYNDVTVTGSGQLTLTDDLTIEGALVVQAGGTLDDGGFAVSGPGTFTLAAGSTLVVRSAQGLSTDSSGTVRVTGARRFSPAASYVYSGSAAQVTGPGLPTRVRNLTVANASGVTLSQLLTIRGVLTVAGAGNLTLNGRSLVLLSDADSTASVLNTGSGVVSGPVTVQRYVGRAVNPGLGYRHLAAPVANTTFADLSAGSFNPVVNPAYNVAANPGAVTPFPTVFGYDEARLNTSPATTLSAFDKGWVSPASLTEPMAVGRGYTVNLAGGQTLDFVGALNNGTLALVLPRTNATDGGWHLLGNPYPSALDWSQVAMPAGLDAAMYTFQSSSQYGGTYRSYNNGIGNPYLALGQAFFVRTSAGSTSATLTLTNQARTAVPNGTATLNRTAAETRPLLQLSLRNAAGLTDDAYVYFQAGAAPGYDAAYDAYKLPNPSGLDLATVAADTELSISGLPLLLPTPTAVPLNVRVPQAGAYTLQAAQLLNFPATDVYLLDAQTGLRTNLTQQPSYAFNTSTTAAAGRFTLEFMPRNVTAAQQANALAAGLSLYPNPAQGRCLVQVPVVVGARTVDAVVYNALGQPVRRQQAAQSTGGTALTLDLAGLPAGVYSVRVQAGADAATKRLVVQ